MLTRRKYEILGTTRVHRTARIQSGAVIGKPFRPLLAEEDPEEPSATEVGRGAFVGHYSLIGEGTRIGAGSVLDDFSIVESHVTIGERVLVIYRGQICNEATIGDGSVIGGFVGERVSVGQRCRVFGEIVHTHRDPSAAWDDPGSEEPSAVLGRCVFVGFGAIVVGGVTIGDGAYVCAKAVVTRDVLEGQIVHGVNEVTEPEEWAGSLGDSPFFRK